METASLTHSVGRSRIVVSYRNIIGMAVEVIVSSDDVTLSMGGGVSKAIRDAAGETVFVDAQRSQPTPLGSVVVTGPGTLQHKFVFHAAVLDFSLPDLGVSEQVVRAAVRGCFAQCTARGIRSIAFPALATGTARLTPEQSASAILIETLAYLETQPELEDVHLVLHPEGAGDRERRFYLQVQQYLALSETAGQIHRAAYHYQQFAAAPSRDITPESPELAVALDTLNTSMVAGSTGEFNENVAPKVSRSLSDEIDKLQARLGADPKDRSNIRLRAETLRLQQLNAFSERQRLEWEDTLTGTTTEERTERKAFLQTQEDKFSAELLNLERSTRPVVISIHGIRTRGAWQKEITPALNYAGFTHVPLDYGRFGLLRFLRRSSRQEQVVAFNEAYRQHGAKTTKGSPSIIAHSLGSYIVTEAMAKYNLHFDQMVLCGAIVKCDYDWETAHEAKFVTRVLNDHGRLDIWARVAELVLSDAGPSGLKGFTRTAGGRVVNRDHARFGHSDYFYQQNYTDNWIPFLLGDNPAPLVNLGPTGVNWKFWLTVTLLVAIVYVLFRISWA